MSKTFVNGQEFPWLDGSIANLQALPRLLGRDGITTREELLAAADPDERPFLAKIKSDLMECMLKPKNRKLAQSMLECKSDQLKFMKKGLDEGKKLVYFFFAMEAPEIFLAMDLIPICFEDFNGANANFFEGEAERVIDEAIADGSPDHLCSASLGGHGMFVLGEIPRPDIIFKNIGWCDPSTKAYEAFCHTYKVPYITVEVPYYANDRAFQYYLTELKLAIKQLEEMTGSKLNEDQLREYVNISNEQMSYIYKLQEMRKQKPCPDTGWHRSMDTAFSNYFGYPELTPYWKTLYEEVKERYDGKKGVIPDGMNEIRTIMGYAWAGYAPPIYDWMEEAHGATYVECFLTYWPTMVGFVDTTNLDTMLRGLAWRSFNAPMQRQAMTHSQLWIHDILRVCREYKIDSLLLLGNRACKHFWAMHKLVAEQAKEELGIPSCTFEFEIHDSRIMPQSMYKRKLGMFFEMIQANRE